MRRFLLSLVMVISTLFAMADITDGGTVPFSSGRTETVYGCSGEEFEITVTCLNGVFLEYQYEGSGVSFSNWTNSSSNGVTTYSLSGTFGSEEGTYPVTVSDQFDPTSSMTLNFKVGANMADPTITVSGVTSGSYIVGETYGFSANTTAEEVEWWVYPEDDGFEFIGERYEQSTSLKFTEAGDYTIRLNADNYYGACMKSVDLSITVNAASSSQQITYTAPNATLCKGGDMAYTVTASESIPSTTTLKMVVGLESFTGYSKGESYVFDLSGISSSSGTFNAEIVDVTNNNTTVATSTITIFASPYVVIESQSQSFSTGTSYEFTATSDASNGTYSWSMGEYPNGGTYEFVNGYSSQSTTIKFSTAGQYELWCAVTDGNGCSSNNFKYVTVEGGSSTPVTVTNGGSVTFVPGTSATLVGCEGDFPYVSFVGDNLDLAQPQSGSGSGQANYFEGSYNSFTFEFVSAGTYYFNIYPVGQENDVMVLNIQINEKPDVPTITSSDDTFLAGQTYTFTANTLASDVTYEWTLSSYPYDGASIVGDKNTFQNVSVEFNSALQPGEGTFQLYCEVTSNGCKATGQKDIVMSNGAEITYTAQPQTFCYKNDGQYEYVVKASQAVEEDDYIMVLLSYSSYYGSHHSDAIDGDEIYFRLNNLPAAEYEVMIYSSDSLNLLVESATMTVGAPIRPTISWEDGDFYVDETVSFFNENYDETLSYTWSVDNIDHTFVGATDGEGVSIQFLSTGEFVVKCEATENGCTSFDTYSLEVVNAVCSINSTKYGSLAAALDDYENGDEITILSDINEAATNKYIDGYNSFTINTNGHTVTFGEIEVMASITVTGGGVLTTSLSNSDVNGPDVLTVDDATLNLAGSQWTAKNITIENGGNITLTNGIFLGGGDEDGFNLSIDNTSSFNVNGQTIDGYNYERVASQISPYLPSGYTVTGTSDGLVFSPNANVTLSVQSAEPITYTAEAVTTCFNQWDEGEFVVTASDMVEGSYVMTFGTNELTTQRTDGDKIYFELKNIPVGTYTVTFWNSDKTEQLCTSTLTILEAGLNVDGPEEGVTGEPITFTVTNPISGMTYEWSVEMYGGDSNYPANASSYSADSFEGTSFTVTFLEADEYYRISCYNSCGNGTEMALEISEAPNYVKVIELPKSSYGENLWQINSSGATTLVQDAISAAEVDDYTPQIGDVFSYTLKGVASFTGTVGFYLVDVSSAACYWAPFTDSTASYHETNQFQVTKGESFEISGELEITNLSWDNWRTCGAVTLTNPSFDIEAHSADGLLEDEVVTLSLTEYSLTFTEAEIERTYYVFGKAIACNGETTTVQIAAPQGFANPSDIKITGQMGTITPTSVEDTLATFENVQAYRWTLKDGDDNALSFSVAEETLTAEISGPATVTVDEEVTYTINVTVNPETELEYSWGGGVESAETETSATGSFSAAGEEEVFCFIESATGCSYNITYPVTVQQPAVSVSFPQEEYEITVGDSTKVCLNITSTDTNFNLDNITVAYDDTEGGVQFIPVSGETNCVYIKALTTAGSSTEVSATVTYNNKEYSATTLVSFQEAPQETEYTVESVSFCEYSEEEYSVSIEANPAATFDVVLNGQTVESFEDETSASIQISGEDVSAGTYTYNIVEGGAVKTSFTVTVLPRPQVSVTASQNEICAGDTIQYTATVETDGTYSWEWEGSESIIGTETLTPKDVPTSTGTQWGSITVTGENGCSYTADAEYTVLSSPSVEIEGSTEVTAGEQVTYTANAVDAITYTWLGAVQGSEQTLTTTFTTAGSQSVICEVTNEYSCKAVDTLVVTVSAPETVFTISEKSTLSVCQGESATVIITAEPAATFTVVSSDNETVYTAEKQGSVSFALSATTTSTYYIVENGTQKESFTIEVNEKPTVTISATQSVVCVGDEVQLEAIMNLSDGSYYWSGADFDDATSGNPTFVALNSQTITCTVTGAGNCQETAEYSLMVYPTPTVTISGPAEAYVGDEVEYTATLTASNMPSTATFTYEWGGGVESYDTDTKAKGSFSESDIDSGAEVFCNVATTDGTCATMATYPVVVKAKTQYWISDTVFCIGSKGYITITCEEAINDKTFTVETSYNEGLPYTISSDDPNVALINYASLPYPTAPYSINILENGEIVKSFQLIQNNPPLASFTCPTSDEAVVGETWNVSGPMAEGASYSYEWLSDGISFDNPSSVRQAITFETAGPVWVALAVTDEATGCTGRSDTCRFTIDAGGQKYFVPEEVTWCHGAESGRVTIPVTSNQEIPASLTVNHDWATNIETEINGTEATISFDYPYNGRQGFQLITVEGGDTTVVVENVNAFGKGHLLPSFPEDQDSVVIFGNGNTIELMAGGNAGSTSGSWYTALGSQARFNWTKDDEVSQECLADMINEGSDCNNARVRFTFPQTGTYSVGFSISDDGCTSDFIYKNIYVVDFDPALFSIAPVKDTIEIGAPNGAQFTLNYDGEPYSNYTLKSDGDVTIDGTSVFDNEIVGTFEVYAEVSDLRVATAWITVIERPIEYTVENVSVCEGTDEAEAIIYASGSIEGKTVTVRDEDGNTLYPEYNDNNDAATVHLNYLSTGTYTYKVYENDVYKTEFTVKVNSLPSVYIDCPIDPVVGDTWTPNTAVQEGLTYSWSSRGLEQLNGYTSCCPTVTFEETGSAYVALTVTNENGCSNSATCSFEVGEKPQEYFLNCPDHDLSIKDEDYLMYVSAGDTEGKTLTWSTADDDIVSLEPRSDRGECVVTFLQVGTAQIKCEISESGKTLELVQCTLNIVQPQYVEFSQHTIEVEKGGNTIVCLTAEGIDLSQATITFGSSNDEAFVVAPSDGLSGCAVVSGLEITEYTEEITATVQYNEGSETKTFEASADIHVVEPFVCEGTKIVGGEVRDLPYANIEIGDKFRFKWIGTSNFTGTLHVHIEDLSVDTQTPETRIMSQFVAHQVYKGETYTFDDILEIQTVSESQSHNYKLYFSPMPMDCPTGYDESGDQVCYGVMCEQYYAIGKEETQECQQVAFEYSAADNNYIYSADGLAYEAKDGDKFNVSWTATSDFSGTINLALIDKSAEANYWQEVSSWASIEVTAGVPFSVDEVFTIDGLVSTSPEIALFATVNDQVDGASFCMTNFWFHKLGDIVQECTNYELDGENSVQLQYVYNGDNIAVGDTYNYEVFGTADFTGDLFFSLVDQSEEVGYWDMLADSKVFSVVEGERFEIKGAFTVTKEPTSSYPEINFTVGRIDATQSGETKTICVLSSAIYKSNGGDECYNKIVVDGGNSAVLNRVSNYQVSVGEVYEYYVSGVADFTGEAMVSFADASKDADYYFALAEPVTFAVTEGESFSQRGTFVVKNQTPSEYPDFTLMIAKNNGVTGESSSFCIDGAYIEKQVQSYTMSEQEVNMFVGGTKYIYLLGDGQPYSGYVEWGVTDLSGSTTPCVKVDYGEIYANSEGQAKIYAKVNDQVVATAIVTVTTFSCDGGELYTVANNGDMSYIEYPLSGITAGDSYKVTINGKTDYDGVLVTAVADFSAVSEDDGPSQGSNLGEIMVKAGQEFSYNTILTVVPTAASAPNYKMILVLGGSEELDELKLCATQLSVEKFTAQYTIDGLDDSYMFVGETKQLTIKNIDGTVYGGDAQWVSTDENVVAIGDNGYVYAKSVGVAEVQVIIGGDIAATAFISVENATDVTIGLDKPGYEIANVGDEQIVYINASGLQAATFTYQYDESIIEVTPIQGTNTLRVKGLKVGSTHLFVYATLDGESYNAGAVVEVGGSTSNDYTLAFAQSKYEITEGESMRACLTIGEGFKHFDPQFNFDQTVISISNPTDNSNCGVITGLKAGQTFVEVIAEAPDGKFYSAQTEVIVNAKYTQDDYKLSFEQETYEVYEGETIEACLIIGRAFEHGFQPTMSYDETIITVNEPTAAQSDNCGSVTGVKEGTSLITLDVEKDGTHYTAKTHIVVLKKNVELPQMAAPVVSTEMVTLCYSKTAVSDNMTSLDEYVEKSSTDARLKWYDAAGNALTTAPIIDPKTVGKRIYYVSQIASGYNESEKVALSVNIVYVAAPELNIYEQKVCDNTQTQAFVAKSQNNEIYWYQGEGNPVAQNTNTFMPTEAGTYLVRAIDVANGCVSDFATVNYAVGHTIRPQIQVEKTEYALDEKILLAVQAVDEEQYGVVWTIEGEVIQGSSATATFAEEGTYKIPCTIVEKESGCFASDTVTISVKNTNIPVTAIAVEPSAIELYEGEQSYLALSFTPAFATDRNYNIVVADTSVADVVGLTVFGLKEGVTTATISSTSNTSATASITITVKKFVAAREISLPTVITMAPEETKTISAAVLPTNASYNEVFFNEKEDNVIRLSANGELTALAEGTSIITAYTKGGLKASSVVVVTASVAAITDIQVPEKIEMKVGDSVSVSYKVVPVTSLISQLNWSIADEELISFENGVVKAEKAGSTTLTVSFASIEKSIAIVVNESDAPVVITTPNVSATQGTDVKVTLSDVISDDNTAIEDLTVTTTSENFNVTVENGVLTVTPKDNSFIGVDTVTVVVTDENNLSVELPVVVEITEIQNQAPVILMDTIVMKFNACSYILMKDLVSDDFTSTNQMKYTFSSKVKATLMLKKQLRLFTDDPEIDYDILTMTATDAEGLTTTKEILLLLTALPNKAPKIAEIPTQNENDSTKFGVIDLAQYVKDDYTSSAAIAWTAADAENLAVTISEGKATVKVLNEFWNGAAAITFYAKDEEGLTDSTVVYYVRNVTIKKEEPSQEPTTEVVATWEGAPSFDFMTMKTIGVPGAQFILMASCSGYDCTWSWDIPGANGVDPTSLMQMITFDEPGTYDVTFTVQSPDGNFEKSITKENFLTVVGINERTPAICKGDAVSLTATEGLDSYYWSTGDVKNTTIDRPEATALYQVTMKKGMFTLIDTVTVKVSVPVALMEDSVMCKGTTFDLEAQGDFESYTWNTGESTKAIALPDVVATYSVMAVDNMQCVSVDTFNLTTVNALPAINLGDDQTPCDGTTVTLDAGAGYEYLWKNGSTEQTISLTAGTDTVWARIIDNNLCVNYDTVVVAFTYPYPEQLGVATFSETTDHIILAWEKTAGVNTVSYRIERETNVTDNWEKVGDDVMFSEAGLVVDEDVNYKQRAYKYRLVTTDGCGNEAVSEVHRSMISTTTRNDDGTKTLQWCAYEPMANVTQYLVLRGYDATKMDTVDQVPASNLYEIWNETDSRFVNDKDIKYRVVFRLKSDVNENTVNTLDGQKVEGYYTKAESGPFSLAMSNIAEAENVAVEDVPFADVIVYPTTFSSYINVAIAATIETNFKVEILNANGQVMARTQTGDVNKTVLQIPTDNFKQGVYTVKISDGQQTKTLKVVK